ncbi:sodium:proton antiporter [Streptomyces sp. SID4945]|nr:sodium:proton antiporter [Streptomyces sp. SID4945]
MGTYMDLSGTDLTYGLLGLGALGAATLPTLLRRWAVSVPMVFLGLGFVVFLLPLDPLPSLDPVGSAPVVEHFTEVCVLVALMGAGLAINRPFGRRTWASTWRLLGVAMPVTVLAAAVAGWGLLGWAPAVALLLAGILAPTDPVLAGEVRVGEPTDAEFDEDETRFALTSEAGLNDGLAFPFVMAALALSAASATGWSGAWVGHWLGYDVLLRIVVGVLAGTGMGALLGRVVFRARPTALRVSERSEGFVALAVAFGAYGLTEVLHGYGFLAVFATAVSLRSAERAHGYHRVMHSFMDQIERLLTAAVLFLVGGFLAQGGFAALTWRGAVFGLLLVLVIRPVTGYLSLRSAPAAPRERAVTAFFGIRGIGSFFYLSYALGHGHVAAPAAELWATVTFTVVVSVLLHGILATPVVRYLDRREARAPAEATEAGADAADAGASAPEKEPRSAGR